MRCDAFRSFAWFALLMLLALTAGRALAQEEAPLRIGAHDQPPLSIPGGKGLFDQMLRELFARAGLSVELAYMPYERSLVEANVGTLDGEASRLAGMDKLYPNLVMVPECTFIQEFVAFAVRPGISFQGWAGLRPYSVGYLIGWKILEENVKAASVWPVADPLSLFSMLKSGRIDLAIYERNGGTYFARELGIEGIYTVEPPLASQPIFLYLNRKHEALAPVLARALKEMKEDGTYEKFFRPLK